jgi:hypothetical protein
MAETEELLPGVIGPFETEEVARGFLKNSSKMSVDSALFLQ